MIHRNEKICPRCDAPTMKSWQELADDEKDMFERLTTKLPITERKKHRICTRCWFEDAETTKLA
jgi:hypothetical protein